MVRTPVILSVLVTLAALAGVAALLRVRTLQLSHAEMLQSFFAIVATWGAFISAIFVIYGYLQTNLAFVESQRPQLLIQVENQFVQGPEPSQRRPLTIIHYSNITSNMFRDLTISVHVIYGSHDIDLSDLFKSKMVMVGTDRRQRRFEPLTLLNGRGLDLNASTPSGHVPRLKFSYSYTYSGKVDVLELHEYKWNRTLQVWEIA